MDGTLMTLTPPTGTVRGAGRPMRSHKFRKLRALWIAEQAIKGVPMDAIAASVKLHKRKVYQEMERAVKQGWLEQVRERLAEPLKRAPEVYDAILNATPEELQKNAKGWALKREAVKDLAAGMGAFRTETQQTKLVGLAAWHAQQQGGPDGSPDALSEGAIDGEVVPQRQLSSPIYAPSGDEDDDGA